MIFSDYPQAAYRRFAALFGALLYLEIMYLMVKLSILFGKPGAAVTGVVLSLLLSIHLIRLYGAAEGSTAVHLIILDIHSAWALGGLVMAAASLLNGEPCHNMAVPGIRAAAAFVEIFLVIALLDSRGETS